MNWKMKYLKIKSAINRRKPGEKIYGCPLCEKENHHVCDRCFILIHSDLKKHKNKQGFQYGIYCEDVPALCLSCALELGLTEMEKPFIFNGE